VQYGQAVCLRGDHESRPPRRRAAWRQRHDAGFRRREVVSRRRHLPAYGRNHGYFAVQDCEIDVSGDGWEICGAGVSTTLWRAFLDTYRTLCLAPSPEIREI